VRRVRELLEKWLEEMEAEAARAFIPHPFEHEHEIVGLLLRDTASDCRTMRGSWI
jgi:hypothetical protein